MTDLLEYITKRRDELRAEKKRITNELRQLKAAEDAARGAIPLNSVDSSVGSPISSASDKMTIQDYILAVLRRFPDGIDANQINDEIKAEFDKDYMRSSLSPQLSRLKGHGKVKLKGKIWRLSKENPAEAGSQDAGELAERINAPDLKSDEPGSTKNTTGSEGSNPSLSAPNSSEVAPSDDEAEGGIDDPFE